MGECYLMNVIRCEWLIHHQDEKIQPEWEWMNGNGWMEKMNRNEWMGMDECEWMNGNGWMWMSESEWVNENGIMWIVNGWMWTLI